MGDLPWSWFVIIATSYSCATAIGVAIGQWMGRRQGRRARDAELLQLAAPRGTARDPYRLAPAAPAACPYAEGCRDAGGCGSREECVASWQAGLERIFRTTARKVSMAHPDDVVGIWRCWNCDAPKHGRKTTCGSCWMGEPRSMVEQRSKPDPLPPPAPIAKVLK